MKNYKTLIFGFAGLFFLVIAYSMKIAPAVPAEKRVSIVRNLNAFQIVEINAPVHIILKQGESYSATIEAADNVISHIETKIEQGKLIIKLDKTINSAGKINMVVTGKMYSRISASGNVNIGTEGKLNLKNLSLDLSGDNKADLNLDVQDLQTKSDGESEIVLRGSVKRNSIKISGNSTIKDLTVN